jgi:hypothetical protein
VLREQRARLLFFAPGDEEFELRAARHTTDRLDETEYMTLARDQSGGRLDRDVEQRAPALRPISHDPTHARTAHQQRRRERVRQADTEIEAARAQRQPLAQQRADSAVVRAQRQHRVEPRRARDQRQQLGPRVQHDLRPRVRRAQRAEAGRRHHDVARPTGSANEDAL